MARVSAQQLAELAACSPEYVQRLADLGLLGEDEDDGLFASTDVHLVGLMAAFEEAGISLEDVARGVAVGELSFPLGLFDLLRRLSSELGLPPPDDDRVRDEDAEILSLLVTRLDLADDDELSRFARLYGGSVQRMVVSGLQFFDTAVQQRVGALGLPSDERDRMVYERAAGYTELVSRVVPWLQRRHRERSVLE